jgi:hypothetical protein
LPKHCLRGTAREFQVGEALNKIFENRVREHWLNQRALPDNMDFDFGHGAPLRTRLSGKLFKAFTLETSD